jgi:hypothetical protein
MRVNGRGNQFGSLRVWDDLAVDFGPSTWLTGLIHRTDILAALASLRSKVLD